MKAGRRLLPLLALGMFLLSAPSINGKVRPAAYPANGRLELTEVADLGGDTLLLPPETTIQLRGGYFRNGTVVGHKTSIRGQGPAFDHVRIAGTWHVPVVRTSLLVDASYENALRDIMALTSQAIRNKVIIEKGEYRVTALKEKDTCVPIGSNTEVIVEGTIRLTPNPFQHYNILCTEGENIRIHGHGSIIGDKHTHTGTDGEWGMGIRVSEGKNVHISQLNIRDCWGDCIYVGGGAREVLIEDCRLDHGRRQGISITKAEGVTIRKCVITNVEGTNPQYAIDIEPNIGDTVDDILVECVTARNCKGGYQIWAAARDSRVGSVTFRRCQATAERCPTIAFSGGENVVVERCDLQQLTPNSEPVVWCRGVQNLTLRGNTLRYDAQPSDTIPLHLIDCGEKDVRKNRLIPKS